MKASRTRLERWYELDNAAKIYPAIHNSRWTSNFRMSVTLKEQIDPALLQKAQEEYAGRAESGYVCPIEPDAVPIAI